MMLPRSSIALAGAVAVGMFLSGAVVGETVTRLVLLDQGAGGDPARYDRQLHDALLRHPELLIEMRQLLGRRQASARAEQARAAIARQRAALFADPADPVSGNPRGDVTLVEFLDYNCIHCRTVFPLLERLLAQDPHLRVVYKEYPILGAASAEAARYALAAQRQGKFEAFHAALMGRNGVGALDSARKAGLDISRLRADAADAAVSRQIDRNMRLGRAVLAEGTPAFVVGQRVISGETDVETLRQAIAEERGRTRTRTRTRSSPSR